MKRTTLLLFILPSFLWILASRVIPLVHSFVFSLYDYRTKTPTFVYFDNFARLLDDPVVFRSALNTIWFTSANVVLVFSISLACALVLNREFRGKSILRSMLVIPWAIPTITAGLLWLWMLNAEFGVINTILFKLHVISEYKTWLFDPFWAMFFLIVASAWKDFPIMTIIFLAGLGMVPQDLNDAAAIDGASSIQRIRHVSLPYIRYVLLTGLLMQLIESIKAFDMIYVLTRGGPADSTLTLFFYAFRQGFQSGVYNFGYSAALADVGFLSCVVFYLFYLRLYRFE